ncbi:hypothetical protein BST81_12860 [Leptolyngbya sp. 'hensonii']|nr:hypothetical protein BST81_12860 [Leptolyngbya sp. 'hensonii']
MKSDTCQVFVRFCKCFTQPADFERFISPIDQLNKNCDDKISETTFLGSKSELISGLDPLFAEIS